MVAILEAGRGNVAACFENPAQFGGTRSDGTARHRHTTFHHAKTGANVITIDYWDWATNCPEYKVIAVQVRRTNQPSD